METETQALRPFLGMKRIDLRMGNDRERQNNIANGWNGMNDRS